MDHRNENNQVIYGEDNNRPIAIMSRRKEGIGLLLKKIDLQEEVKYAGVSFYIGKISGKRVVVCNSGMGKVNAAITTQILIDKFNVREVIFIGIAGSIQPNIQINDIVICNLTQQYDLNYTIAGYSLGTIPFMEQSIFEADTTLVKLAEKAANSLYKDVFIGKALSGDMLVKGRQQAFWLVETFGGFCVDTSAGSVGQVCYVNNIPFVGVKSISDLVWLGYKNIGKSAEYAEIAGLRVQNVVLKMLEIMER